MTASASAMVRLVTRPRLEDEDAPAILSIGFRPFFLVATLTAIVWVPFWLYLLRTGGAPSYMSPLMLHAHEMIYGFTVAVVAGFLLTAGANWTNRATTSGWSLGSLIVLWSLGRLAMLSDWTPLLVALIDVSFLPALGLVLAWAFLRADSRRNFQFLLMIAALSAANLAMHMCAMFPDLATHAGVTQGFGQTMALRVITFMMLVMGGRVIPMFTRNATRRDDIRQSPGLDRVSLVAFLLACVADPWTTPLLAGALFMVAGVLQLLRMRTWGSFGARAPLLWILHFGFASVAVSLILEGIAHWGLLPTSPAIHLLTVGGIGGLCLGMMTRVSLGHSGRNLIAPVTMRVAFVLLVLATLLRVGGPMLLPARLFVFLVASGTAWTLAFSCLFFFGLPIWTRPRVDQALEVSK